MTTGLSAFKWNFTALKELVLPDPCIRKWPFAVGYLHDLCQAVAVELLTVLILAPATQGWARMALATGCMLVFWPLPHSTLSLGLFSCMDHRAAAVFSRMISYGAVRMAQWLVL